MSALVRLLNDVRTQATVDWLTPGQREAYEFVRARILTFSPTLLIGPPGRGKTLIGWLLRSEVGVAHATDLAGIPTAGAVPCALVIDNADLSGRSAREVLAQAHLRGWTSAALLARWMPSNGIPAVHVPSPTAEDVRTCLANLQVPHGGNIVVDSGNLWLVLRSLLESGEARL